MSLLGYPWRGLAQSDILHILFPSRLFVIFSASTARTRHASCLPLFCLLFFLLVFAFFDIFWLLEFYYFTLKCVLRGKERDREVERETDRDRAAARAE